MSLLPFEWDILQSFGDRVSGRLTTHQRSRRAFAAVESATKHNDNPNMTFLETALRLLLTLTRNPPITQMLKTTYVESQGKLRNLCLQLEGLAVLSTLFTEVTVPSGIPGEPSSPRQNKTGAGAYPNLVAFLDLLEHYIESSPTSIFDLVSGPNKILFPVSPGPLAENILALTDICNTFLLALCSRSIPRGEPSVDRIGLDNFGKGACSVLEVLFEKFGTCEPAHQVLLSLGGYGEHEISTNEAAPILDLLLSDCSNPEKWQEAQCLPHQ